MWMCDVQCVVRNKQLFEMMFENLFETAVRISHSKVAVFEHMFEIHFEQGFEQDMECSVYGFLSCLLVKLVNS